jgi:hypothetical protein
LPETKRLQRGTHFSVDLYPIDIYTKFMSPNEDAHYFLVIVVRWVRTIELCLDVMLMSLKMKKAHISVGLFIGGDRGT